MANRKCISCVYNITSYMNMVFLRKSSNFVGFGTCICALFWSISWIWVVKFKSILAIKINFNKKNFILFYFGNICDYLVVLFYTMIKIYLVVKYKTKFKKFLAFQKNTIKMKMSIVFTLVIEFMEEVKQNSIGDISW